MDTRVFALCSGSGGVGKSTFALALACEAASTGMQTILLDANGVSRSCDLMLGMESVVTTDLVDVLSGQAGLQHALYSVPQRDKLRLCCTSLLSNISLNEFAGVLLALRSMCDVLVIDLPTGDPALVTGLLSEEDMRVFLVRPDDSSLRAAERMLMLTAHEQAKSAIVLCRAKREMTKKGFQYSEATAAQILDRPITGCIWEDDAMAARIGKRNAWFSFAGSARAQLDQVIKNLLKG